MRRIAILSLVVVSFAALAQEAPQPQAQQPPRVTPEQLWSALMAGNKTFVAGKIAFDDLKQRRELTLNAQIPPITVLSCSDSRVPTELVFNQSLGVMFVVRSAGNIADDLGVASIEFAILNGWTRLLVVLGHENCGAVKAALGGADPNTQPLSELARRIRMSFIGVPYDSRDAANLRKATEMNVRASAAHLLASSKIIRDAVLTEQVKLISAYYDHGTGEVRALE
jgi:carbonic anhydrase